MAITIKDIARESGYAVGTVSRVLNNHPDVSDTARAKIMEVVEKHHFKLNSNAKHLKQQVSNGIAIIVKGSQNMLFAPIVEQMQGMLREKGLACLIYYINEMENEVETAVRVCTERRPVGIMFLGCNLSYFQKRFQAIHIPCVLVTNSARSLEYTNLSSVSIDDTEAAKAAVSHLIENGHREIGILGGHIENSKVAYTRYIGCKEAFESHNVPFSSEKQYIESLFGMSDGYSAMQQLLQKMPQITAVFAMSDVMAVGAIRAIKDSGRKVPEDISVVGFDGLELGEFISPKLTTIKQNREKIAQRSVEILLDTIDNGAGVVYETVPFSIIVGESTKQL
ncbi:MAG: LacI family DNA-binding transcriptional regulator [Oscillospiraceae bacterium]|nr:LacI family DNA-binding transcriptional regulator [Oscillospiraceae bacterium]